MASSTPISGGNAGTTVGLLAAAAAVGVPDLTARSWVRRYGSNAGRVLAQWQDDPAARDVIGPRWLTLAEVRYCVAEEMVLTLSDLLVRRTSLFFWDASGTLAAADQIAAALATELGWDDERRCAEIEAYRVLVSQHLPGH